jgi:hypothetical protein
MVGTGTSQSRILTHNRLSHPDVLLEPQAHRQNCQGDEDAQSQCRV